MNNAYNEEITARIIEQLEQGVVPWRRPWAVGNAGARSWSTGKKYSLLNQLLLGGGGTYITYNQAKACGGHVKKGAKGKRIYFWNFVTKTIEQEDGTEVETDYPFLKKYLVFNVRDCDGVPEKFLEEEEEERMPNGVTPSQYADALFADYCERVGVTYELDDLRSVAYYSPTFDIISIPRAEQFYDTSEYYSTLFHEAVHSTGHASRLNRKLGGDRRSKDYAREELVAEIGACGMLQRVGLESPKSFSNSASYVDGWMKALSADKGAILYAAGRAEKAVRMICNDDVAENASQTRETAVLATVD